jgi:hypothetical protein
MGSSGKSQNAIYTCQARVLLGANCFWLRELRLLIVKAMWGLCFQICAFRAGTAIRSVNLHELLDISWGTS